MAKNILHTIEKNMISFSKGQKLIARYILDNYDKAAFMTARGTTGIRACSARCRR